ncbi:hypothetical protein B0H14DRAFT_3431893 [Mycena olivaceomarginata]|nr:hypothetical protein B0H14DRAFT_3431893 [Mycena olivaceomarginata]
MSCTLRRKRIFHADVVNTAAFAHGRTEELLANDLIGRLPRDGLSEDEDWHYYYVNFFVDRDMYMRYRGGGVGHYNIVIPPEDEPAGGEDEEDLDEPDPPVPDEPKIPPTPPGTPDPADTTPLPDRPASSHSTNSSSSDSSVQSGLTGAGSEGDGSGGESDEEPDSVVDSLGQRMMEMSRRR